jgi:hypothetical protein
VPVVEPWLQALALELLGEPLDGRLVLAVVGEEDVESGRILGVRDVRHLVCHPAPLWSTGLTATSRTVAQATVYGRPDANAMASRR